MRRIFVDTNFWSALINPKDQWREWAINQGKVLVTTRAVTTDEVLTETLNYFSEWRRELRVRAVEEVRTILLNQNVEIVSCTHGRFPDAVELFENRPDKGYSLTDCISMNTCRHLSISEILTHDDHFSQEGFSILL